MKEEIRHRRPIEREGFAMLYHVLTLDKELSDRAFRLYALLLKYAQQKDHAYPGMERLARELGKTRQAISTAMTELKDRGLISRQRRYGTSSMTWIEDPNEVYQGQMPDDCKENFTTVVKKTLPKEEEDKKKKRIPGATDFLLHCAEIEKNQQQEGQWSTPGNNGLVTESIAYLYELLGSTPPKEGSGTWRRLCDTIEPVLRDHNVADIAKVRAGLARFREEKPTTFDPFYKSFPGQLGVYLGKDSSKKKVIKVGR